MIESNAYSVWHRVHLLLHRSSTSTVVSKEDLGSLPVDVPLLRVVFPERVFFDTAQWNLRPDAISVIDVVAESLRREPPDVAVFVAGHADSRGSRAYNFDLSLKRANAVSEALVRRGVGQAAIWRIGFGEAVPLRSNATTAGMALKPARRVCLCSEGQGSCHLALTPAPHDV